MHLATKKASSHDQSPTRRATAPHNFDITSILPFISPVSDTCIQRTDACACGGGCSRCQSSLPFQAKLKIGQPNDIYEQEADRVADQVMRMPDPVVQRELSPLAADPSCGYPEEKLQTRPLALQISPLVQRQPVEEEEEDLQAKPATGLTSIQRVPMKEGEELIQAKTAGEATHEAAPAVDASIQSLRGGGRPMSKAELNFFEPRFGADFTDVRVHSDGVADNLARSVKARAFTLGRDIYFGLGKYRPNTSAGRLLLAHELTHTIQQSGKSLRSMDWNIPIGSSRRRITAPNVSLESGSDTLRRSPDFRQTVRLRRSFTYVGDDGTFQSHNFSPDLSDGIRSWLARRMRVFTNVVSVDSVLRDLLTAFRRAHRILGARVALRRGQHYTYAARIDLSGGSIQISDVRINNFSPTAERVLSRLTSFPPMQWEPAGACATDFCLWVIDTTETPAPPLATTTTMNCWEAILLAAYYAGVVSWRWLHNLYDRYHSRGDAAFANMLSRGRRTRYSPPRYVPVRGDIVFFWTGNHLSHVGLATGRLNPPGQSPEVIGFQGRFTAPSPPVRARVEPPATRLSGGGRMRIEYARPPW